MTAVIPSADANALIDHTVLVRQYWGHDYLPPSEPWPVADRPSGYDRWPLLAGSAVVGAVMYGGLLLALLSMGSVISGVVHDFGALSAVML